MRRMRPIAQGIAWRRLAARWAFVCLMVASLSAHALSPGKSISQFAMDTWQTDAGLPELAIQTIVETSDGYMWIGTQEGLARFDGAQFTVFDHVNTPALQSDFITAIVEDGDHSLWIGNTQGLVVRRADGTFTRFGAEQGLALTRVAMGDRRQRRQRLDQRTRRNRAHRPRQARAHVRLSRRLRQRFHLAILRSITTARCGFPRAATCIA